MARRQQRPVWDFGRKVSRLLADRKNLGLLPASPADLARAVAERAGRCNHGTVMDWINLGASPRSRTGRIVAEVLGVDPAWLLDDSAHYPPPIAATSLDALLRLIPADQRERLIPILRDPHERAAWIAAWEARRGSRA